MRYDEQLIRRDSGNKHTSSNLCGRGSVTLLQPCPEAVGKPVNNKVQGRCADGSTAFFSGLGPW